MNRIFLVAALAACGGKSHPTDGTKPGSSGETALAQFETVRSVLQHPRCQNCHPAGDVPLQGDDSHLHPQNVQRGPTGNGMVGEECTTCHREANPPDTFGPHLPPGVPSGWHMPTPEQPLVFVGRSPKELCEQIKDPARNGGKDADALRKHLDTDLVKWAWQPGFGRAAPTVSYAEFVAAWEGWYAAGAPCPTN